MLRYSFAFFLFLSLLGAADINRTIPSKDLKKLDFIFKNAMRDFRYGSYYEALDEFSYLAKFPKTPYYLQSLFMLAYTYLYIGKRTGDKGYLWSAINYLNLYLAKGGKEDADYYYLKADIYENLGFYEKALAYYELALQKAHQKSQKLHILVGLFRTSVMFKKLDLATRYRLILSLETLQKEEKKEFDFLQGFYYFIKNDYKKAIEYFKKSYKEYESYLIDNPEFYLLVAETAYRLHNYAFSERLLRRILNYVKNKEVLQKALLRLGDLRFLERDYKGSASYYLRLIKSYPKSPNAIVAKLKLLYILKTDPKIAYYIKKYLKEAKFLEEPQKFVIQQLVKYRTGYIGLFALANFGLEVFELGSAKLFKRLAWEISLVSVPRLTYEQREYLKRLWSPYLQKKGHFQEVCKLYRANPGLFLAVFSKELLLKVAYDLDRCGRQKERIALLKRLYERNRKDRTIAMALARALYENRRFEEAKGVLEKIRKRDCSYYKLYTKVCFAANFPCRSIFGQTIATCGEGELYTHILRNYLNLESGKLQSAFLRRYDKELATRYGKDEVVTKFVQLFAKALIQQERYRDLIDLLGPLAGSIQNDCFLNSVLALSYVRIGKIDLASRLLEKSDKCDNSWHRLAQIALDDAKLQQQIEGM